MAKLELNIDLNRVEGDLELMLSVDDGIVTEARCVGTLYRGFEQILIGRSPRDALVISPRVCGICGTAHLYSGVLALEQIWQLAVPANATRIRDLCLMTENIQSDLRQTFLYFTPDFCNARYRSHPSYDELCAAFEPMRGAIYLETLKVTRELIGIVATFGGQWPHSSYMLPGGVTTPPNARRLLECRAAIDNTQQWYETRVIGAPLQEWLALDNAEDFFTWLEAPVRRNGALALMSRFAREIELHRGGAGTPHMLSYGVGCRPATSDQETACLLRSGFYNADSGCVEPLDHKQINEHVRYSWFRAYDGGRHPWQGETVPDYRPASERYTWAKAPRYGDRVTQTGPLPELLVGGDGLIRSLHAAEGGSAWLRQIARVRRATVLIAQVRRLLDELAADMDAPHFIAPLPEQEVDGQGYGLVMAARGALGHWVCVEDGVISRYQIVTPTAWNASPRDSSGQAGHWEQSLVGMKVEDPDNPVEIGHVIRSHDPCLVCTVHMLETGRRIQIRP